MTTALVTSIVLAVVGQTSAPAGTASVRLADPVVDGHYGFSIAPPEGWSLIRERRAEKRGVTLLRMARRVAPGQEQEIVLRQASATRPLEMGELLTQMHHDLTIEFNQVEVLSRQLQQIADRPGGMLAATFFGGGLKAHRIQAVVELRPRHYFVLYYQGPDALRGEAEPLFARVLATFRLLEPGLGDAELKKAVEAGEQWVAAVTPSEVLKALTAETHLRAELDGKPIGIVHIRHGRTIWNNHDGVEVRELGWMFGEDGTARRLDSVMFLSNDMEDERWRNVVATLSPARGDRPPSLNVVVEEGVRVKDVLLSSQSYGLGQPVTDNPPLQLPRSYLPRVVHRLLPRLQRDLSKPATLAFASFDHATRAVVFRIVEFKGPAESPQRAGDRGLYRVDDREGLTSQPSNLYVDKAGTLVEMKAGSLTLKPAPPQELERLFTTRVHQAERDMAELQRAYEADQQRFRSEPRP